MSQINLNQSVVDKLRVRKIITNKSDIVESTWINNHPSLGKSDQVVWAYGKVMNDFKYVRINTADRINQLYLQNIDLDYILDKNYDTHSTDYTEHNHSYVSPPSSQELNDELEDDELEADELEEEELDYEIDDNEFDDDDMDEWHQRIVHMTDELLKDFDNEGAVHQDLQQQQQQQQQQQHDINMFPKELMRDSDRYENADEEYGFYGDMREDGSIYGSSYDGGYDSY